MTKQLEQTEGLQEAIKGLCLVRGEQEDAIQRGRANPARFLVKQHPADHIEAFLHNFEITAQREKWPEGQWADLLAPFLIGVAQAT